MNSDLELDVEALQFLAVDTQLEFTPAEICGLSTCAGSCDITCFLTIF